LQAGDGETGVCLMQMEKGLDTGPVLLTLKTAIGADDTGGSLHDRLSGLGAEVLSDGLKLARVGILPRAQTQADQGVCYAHKIEKAEAQLDWTQPARVLADKIRAFNPWPVAETELQGERVRLYRARALTDSPTAAPGEIMAASKSGIDVACGEGVLRLISLQRDGGRPLSAAEYLNARPLAG
jgi:methionyl-tRNA formyltransferase